MGTQLSRKRLTLLRRIVHHQHTVDARRSSIAVRDHVADGDLVIVPIRPDRSGLRGVATRVARAIPDHDLIVAFDARSPSVVVPADLTASATVDAAVAGT